MTDRENVAETLMHCIVYQYPTNTVSTYSACMNKCGNQSRGGGRCADCLTTALAEIIGTDLAEEYQQAVIQLRNARARLLEAIDERV